MLNFFGVPERRPHEESWDLFQGPFFFLRIVSRKTRRSNFSRQHLRFARLVVTSGGTGSTSQALPKPLWCVRTIFFRLLAMTSSPPALTSAFHAKHVRNRCYFQVVERIFDVPRNLVSFCCFMLSRSCIGFHCGELFSKIVRLSKKTYTIESSTQHHFTCRSRVCLERTSVCSGHRTIFL